jgi:hypothetical protein
MPGKPTSSKTFVAYYSAKQVLIGTDYHLTCHCFPSNVENIWEKLFLQRGTFIN